MQGRTSARGPWIKPDYAARWEIDMQANTVLPTAAIVSDGCIASLAAAAGLQMVLALLPGQDVILTGVSVDEQALIARPSMLKHPRFFLQAHQIFPKVSQLPACDQRCRRFVQSPSLLVQLRSEHQ